MSWQVTLGGHVESLEAERAIIDKVASFIEGLPEAAWHQWSTAFHGAGDTTNLIKNVEPAEEVDPATVTATPEAGTESPAPDVPPTEEAPSGPVGGGTI